ncbi:MAG: hypothetical protein AB1486_11685 [Planctomycetota bacterium]
MSRGLWLPLLVGTVGTLALALYLALTAPMPGPLSKAHASVTDLTSVRRCGACHLGGTLREGCLECHTTIAAELVSGKGYHAWLDERDRGACGFCHLEHLHEDFPLVTDSSFGSSGRAGFSHPHVAFALDGAHAKLACEACHAASWSDPIPQAKGGSGRRASTYLGLDERCSRCHRDVHDGEFLTACSSCHTQTTFKGAPLLEHDRFFPLSGAHARLACPKCHLSTRAAAPRTRLRFDDTKGRECPSCHKSPHTHVNSVTYGTRCQRCHETDAFSRILYGAADHARLFPLRGRHERLHCRACHERLERPLAGVQAGDCASCHENPHRPSGSLNFRWQGDCTTCHSEESWKLPGYGEEAHRELGLPLAGAHAGVACTRCHTTADPPARARDCVSCHKDPHRQALAVTCAICHDFIDRSWKEGRSRTTAAHHGVTGFPLQGPHAKIDCRHCHPAEAPFTATFPGRPLQACAACHADPHGAELAKSYPSCGACHEGAKFSEHSFGLARHTRFAVDELHAKAACEECHVRPSDGGPAPLRGLGTTCASCHANPHGSQFDRGGRSPECSLCHTSTPGFRIPDFDHAARTGYALAGSHAETDCNKCHVPWLVEKKPVRLYRGTSRECADCHIDPHRGTLTGGTLTGERLTGGAPTERREVTCLDCHLMTGWKPASFDHDKQSRFPLKGAHERLACSACHAPQRLSDGTLFVRYRPLPRNCEACHEPGR